MAAGVGGVGGGVRGGGTPGVRGCRGWLFLQRRPPLVSPGDALKQP